MSWADREGRVMGKTKSIVAERLFDFAAVLGPGTMPLGLRRRRYGGRNLINITVGPGQRPVLLSGAGPLDYRTETDHGSFPKNRADEPNHFRIHHLVDQTWQTVDLAPSRENYYFAQPLPGGRWLLVRSRAASVDDHNARVHGPDGRPANSFHAGDGIADVQVTEQGHAWVSYFDEGVCLGSAVLGANGLVCLADGGAPVFRFGDLADPVVRSMLDCYALNVCSGKEVWLYYYTEFPLVQLVEGVIQGWWPMSVKGAHGFAVGGGRVLLAGKYNRRGSLFLGRLEQRRFEELTPTDEAGRPLEQFQAFGRRHLLYLATEAALHVVDLRSL
jgi:hypothetical protein